MANTKTKIIHISAKCADCFSASLNEREANPSGSQVARCLGEYDGYVPAWFPNSKEEHYGDYVQLQIDVETGQILNWKKPTADNLKSTFKL